MPLAKDFASSRKHFIVCTFGSLGDFLPVLGLARELAHLGHKVDLVAPAYFAPHAIADGVHFKGYGSAEGYARDLTDRRGVDRDLAWLAEYSAGAGLSHQIRAVEEGFAQSGEDCVVITLPNGFGALWAAKTHGLPAVGLVLAPNHVLTFKTPRAISETAYRAAFRGYGMVNPPPPVTDPDRSFLGDYVYSFDHFFELFPSWFDTVDFERRDNTILGTFPGESSKRLLPAVHAFAKAGAPPWIFFPGSGRTLLKVRPDFLELAAQACRRTGRRAVLIDPALGAQVEEHDEMILSCGMTDIGQLLETSAGLCHHGGAGVTCAGLAAALPQIVCPVVFDQPTNAAWLEKKGVATSLAPADLSVEALMQAMATSENLPSGPRLALAAKLRDERGAAGLAERLVAQLTPRTARTLEPA